MLACESRHINFLIFLIMSIIGSIASSLLGGVTSLIGNKINNDNSIAMLDKQNEFTEKMWNNNNTYNNPTNTLQRYLDAGINPSAAVQATLGSNTQASQVQSSSQSAPQMNLANDMISSYNASVASSLADSQVVKNLSDAGLSASQAETENQIRDLKVQGEKIINSLNEETINKVKSERSKIDADKDLVVLEQNLKRALTSYQLDINDILSQTKDIQISMKHEELNQLRANIKELLSRTDKNSAEALYYTYQLKVCDSVIALNYANENKSYSEAGKINAETESINFENSEEQRNLRTDVTKSNAVKNMVGSPTSFIYTVGSTIASSLQRSLKSRIDKLKESSFGRYTIQKHFTPEGKQQLVIPTQGKKARVTIKRDRK